MAEAAVEHGGLAEAYLSLNEDDVYNILEMCL